MNIPAFVPRFANNCIECQSLDYEPLKDEFVKKRPMRVKSPFMLDTLPGHLLSEVLEKMNHDSFTKLRRTNKAISEFISKHRETLRIAMFHDRTLELGICGDTHYLDFSTLETPFHIQTNNSLQKEIFTPAEEEFEREFENAILLKHSTPYSHGRLRRVVHELTFSLGAIMNDIDIKRELAGSYKPYFVLMRRPKESSEDVEMQFKPLIDFLRWAKIKNVALETDYLGPTVFLQACEIIEPRSLKIWGLRGFPEDFLSRPCFKETRAVEAYNALFGDENNGCELKNLGNLKYFAMRYVEPVYFLKLMKGWMNGQLDVNEMWIVVDGEVDLDQFCPISVKKNAYWKYLKDVMSDMTFVKFRRTKGLKSFILQQYDSEKKAFCLFSPATDIQGMVLAYFKVLDSETI